MTSIATKTGHVCVFEFVLRTGVESAEESRVEPPDTRAILQEHEEGRQNDGKENDGPTPLPSVALLRSRAPQSRHVGFFGNCRTDF
jgi:hypothetical protein